jgi:phosphoribosylglycinamide formyltransferase 1
VRVAILVSGRGSNLEAVLRAVEDGCLPRVEPVLVICNRPGMPALAVAERFRVPAVVLRRADFDDAEARDTEIGRIVSSAGAELVLLAGYDQVLRAGYFAAYGGRTINIHPSLLPAHGGKGMVGLAVHASVLAAGERQTGVTIHEVTPELDVGHVLAREKVPVEPTDDAPRLAARVLEVEHRLLVETLSRLCASEAAGTASARMTAGRVRHPSPTTRSGD